MEQDAVADFARDLEHIGVDGGYVDFDVGVFYGFGREEGGHQVEVVEVAAEIDAGAGLPA